MGIVRILIVVVGIIALIFYFSKKNEYKSNEKNSSQKDFDLTKNSERNRFTEAERDDRYTDKKPDKDKPVLFEDIDE
jgi:uncharacterized membrane protein